MTRNSIVVRSLIVTAILIVLITPLFVALKYIAVSIPDTKAYIGYIFVFSGMIFLQKCLPIITNYIYSYLNIIQTETEKELYDKSDLKIVTKFLSIIINVIILIATISIFLFLYGLILKYNVYLSIIISTILAFVSYKGMTNGLNLLLSKSEKEETEKSLYD